MSCAFRGGMFRKIACFIEGKNSRWSSNSRNLLTRVEPFGVLTKLNDEARFCEPLDVTNMENVQVLASFVGVLYRHLSREH